MTTRNRPTNMCVWLQKLSPKRDAELVAFIAVTSCWCPSRKMHDRVENSCLPASRQKQTLWCKHLSCIHWKFNCGRNELLNDLNSCRLQKNSWGAVAEDNQFKFRPIVLLANGRSNGYVVVEFLVGVLIRFVYKPRWITVIKTLGQTGFLNFSLHLHKTGRSRGHRLQNL